MHNSRLHSLIRKEFLQIRRDPRTLALVILIPIMQLILMGYAATTDIRNISLAVFDQDRGEAARQLLDAYRTADNFRLAYEVASEDDLASLIDAGKVRAGLIIPPGYSKQVKSNGSAQVAFILDGSDPTAASTALSAAQMIGQQHATRIQEARLNRTGVSLKTELPVEVRPNVWYNPDLVSAYFMVPGVIAQILYALTSVLTATAVVRERERGTIEQLIVTPIRPWELMIGKITPYVLLALFNTAEVLFLGWLLFGVPIRGSLILLGLLAGLFLFTSLGIGLLASTIANTQQEAMMAVFFTLLPSIFLSGFFFPIEAMPRVLQWISYIVPLRYFLIIIRSLMLKGVGVSALYTHILALAIFGSFIMTLATLRFRKRLE